MKNFYQTIIIGAGPAGLIAGKHLKDKDILILDKKEEIGSPVRCGEGISKKALDFQKIEPDASWVSSTVDKLKGIMSNGKSIEGVFKEPAGYVICRKKFEKFLAEKIKSKIKLNTEVIDLHFKNGLWEVVTKQEVFKSKYIIGADGFNSIVGKKVFPENRENFEFIPAIGYLVETEKEIDLKSLKFYLNKEKYSLGYAWIFPKSKNSANIGVGGEGNLREVFNEFLEKIVKRDYGEHNLLENKSGTIPIRKNDQIRIFKDGAFLVGNAAGLVDPLFKGGMTQAMYSGKIAAESILEEDIESYELKIKSMPFADPELIKAKEILCSLDNQTLNAITEILEGKNVSYFKTLPGLIKFLSNSHLRKNFFKLSKFISVWQKNQDYLW